MEHAHSPSPRTDPLELLHQALTAVRDGASARAAELAARAAAAARASGDRGVESKALTVRGYALNDLEEYDAALPVLARAAHLLPGARATEPWADAAEDTTGDAFAELAYVA